MYLKSAVLYQECDMTCKDNVDNWMSKLATSSNIIHKIQHGKWWSLKNWKAGLTYKMVL